MAEHNPSYIAKLSILKMKAELTHSISNLVMSDIMNLKCIAMEFNKELDFSELEVSAKNLLGALSHLASLVNIDYHHMELSELTQHLEKVIEADKILDSTHPLRREFEQNYSATLKAMPLRNSKTHDQSPSQEPPLNHSNSDSARIVIY